MEHEVVQKKNKSPPFPYHQSKDRKALSTYTWCIIWFGSEWYPASYIGIISTNLQGDPVVHPRRRVSDINTNIVDKCQLWPMITTTTTL
jgi:hypothetical protein